VKKIAGIILAAGASSRFGKPKILIPWQGVSLIAHISAIITKTGITPIFVILGNTVGQVTDELINLPVTVIINEKWESGQSTSLKAGISHIPAEIDAVIVFLADQPFISRELVYTMIAEYEASGRPIIAPSVNGKRTNPVLFDRVTFKDLLTIEGDQGGRAIFGKFPVNLIPWTDEKLLYDIDTPSDLEFLIRLEATPENNSQPPGK
jgi:molybdenum cofactor cytidylyltransferase